MKNARNIRNLQDLPQINSIEWDQLAQIEHVLAILCKAMELLQSRNATIASVLPFYIAIKKKMNVQPNDNDDGIGAYELRLAIINKLDDLMENCKDDKFAIDSN